MLKIRNLFIIIIVFLGILFIFNFTSLPDLIYGDRCCDFEKENIDDVIDFVTAGKSGNVIRLESDKDRNLYFMNQEWFNKEPIIFGEIAKKGQRIIKLSNADTLTLIAGKEKMHFRIRHCCKR